MQIPFVSLLRQHQPFGNELHNSIEALLSANRAIGGRFVEDFENDFSRYLGVNHVVSCANGTDALEIVLRAWDIGEGDEVIVPANGWISVALAVRMVGATPVFLDNDQYTYQVNLNLLESKISSNTKAIIPIHLYGSVVDMERLVNIARKHKIKVLEDCAQAHGAQVLEKKVGGWGHAGIFSFYPTKNLSALGDGGAIVTNDSKLADKCRAVANYGQFEKHFSSVLGRNSRLDSWQAKVLSTKLPYLDQWNQRRRQIANYYLASWADLPATLPPNDESSVWHLFVVLVNHRDVVLKELAKQGIQAEVHYPVPVCKQPILQKYRSPSGYPQAEQQAYRLLSIPLYPELTDAEIEYIATTFKRVIERVARKNQPTH